MKKLLTALLVCFLFVPNTLASYSDVESNSNYAEGITYLELSGAIDGGEEFHPNEKLNRAAFFKILFELLGEDAETADRSTHFKDVPENAWFAPYASLAFKYGLSKGKSFNPDKAVRLVDALNTLLEAYGSSSMLIPEADRVALFQDVSASHPFYMEIRSAIDLDLFSANTSETLSPYLAITRGQFANIIYSFEQWNNVNLAGEEEELFYKSDIFADIWARITEEFYLATNEYIDEEALFEAAIKGLLSSLNDPYTSYFSPDDADFFLTSINGEFEGIGAYLIQDEATGQTFITGTVTDSPAEEAGLKQGDEILEVDGVSIAGMEIKQVVARITGAAGTTVELTIFRDETTLNVEVERAEITVVLEKGSTKKNKVWYIDIDAFSGSTYQGVTEVITKLESELPDPEAVIIDLRGNGGGYLNSANFISGLFVPRLTPLIQLDYGERTEMIYNGDTGPYQDLDVYIFVDWYTASASEIVAATLQENGATVIGTTTFGKGTAQNVVQYWDGSIFKFTVAHWLTGLGKSVNEVGVTPDIVISDSRIEAADEDYVELWFDEFWDEL